MAEDPAIRTLKNLAGKRVGVQSGSYINRYLQGALKAEGVQAQKVHLLATDAEAPLNGGNIAAVALRM
ncbi:MULTISPECIES: ABC transporter substrate-binding protein [Nocardia]|uniref:ABC transporter substrate-binding protein n=1 Tax=Nocardia TaxID=1817 RepID=UPI002457AA65|nr:MULTISPECIES: ABC transporter substrate-binding protein [Nocardia]